VAVLDGDRALVGVVPRQRLLGFLGDEEADPGVCDSPRDKGGEKVMARA
jgi:glycine betaine/proline transport system ATP-binding protein